MFQQVVAKSSADAVFDQVCEQIVGGGLEPGATLPGERELASQLNVSRSVVREALQRLAQAGLAEICQGGATRSTMPRAARAASIASRRSSPMRKPASAAC